VNELSSLLPGFLRQLHFSEELTGELVIALWKNVVGETLARNARPLRMRESTLVLTVSSEAWKKELFSLRFEILRRLEKFGLKISGLELR
jgi:predicted nucleic acid-binding Zn ribbon protein